MESIWEAQQSLYRDGVNTVCGIDEAGRGPLAGPVFAAAVIFPRELVIPGVNDSKKLSPGKREALFGLIRQNALFYGIASASVEEIESLNILNAAMLAMRRAFDALGARPDIVLIDGNTARGFDGLNVRCIPGGDAAYAGIAAASILAKVSRDRYMAALSEKYPQYGFGRHKGYGTKEHREAILRFGPCPEHRPSFLTKLLGRGTRI